MYVQEEVSEQKDDKVLMKRFSSGETAQKQVRFDEGPARFQDQGHSKRYSDTLAEKLRLNLSPTKRRIVVGDGSTGDCAGVLEEILVSFGDIVVRLNFMVIKSFPYDLIIGSPTLFDMCACMYLYHQAV